MLQHRAVFSPIPLLCWSGLCARFPTMCHCKGDVRFLTLQQVSSGQTSRGKFCVSEQLHKQATFLHTNEGFLYAKGAASYLVSCKDLVFWPNSSSATCRAHKVLAICSEQKPLCSWGETRERSISISLCSHVPSHHPNSSLQIQRISVHSGGCPPMSLCCNSSYLTVTGLQIHLQVLGMDRNGAALLFINIRWKSSTKEKYRTVWEKKLTERWRAWGHSNKKGDEKVYNNGTSYQMCFGQEFSKTFLLGTFYASAVSL